MRYTFYIILVFFLLSCEFEAKKSNSEVNNDCLSELYLISNASNVRDVRYEILFRFVSHNKPDLCNLDSSIRKYIVNFYENTSRTRGYMQDYEKLKGIESLYERCEDEYSGVFSYERLENNSNVWILTYPKEFNDTIYCE